MAKFTNGGKSRRQIEIENDYQRRIADAQKQNQNVYNQTVAEQRRLADQQKTATNSQYDKTQNQNYIQYMMNQKDLPSQLARLGLTGGASETAQLRANTNYENTRNNTENSRNAALSNIENTYTNAEIAARNALTNNNASAAQQYNEKMMEVLQAQREKEEAAAERKLDKQKNEYAQTIRRFDTIKKVDTAIAKLRKQGGPKWKIRLLQAQRADLVAAGKTDGSSGGSGRGSGRRSYRGKGWGNDNEKPKPKPKKKNEVAWNTGMRTAHGLARNILKNLF